MLIPFFPHFLFWKKRKICDLKLKNKKKILLGDIITIIDVCHAILFYVYLYLYICICTCVLMFVSMYKYVCTSVFFLFLKLSEFVLIRKLFYWLLLFECLTLDSILTWELTRGVQQRYSLCWTLNILMVYWQNHREREWISGCQRLKAVQNGELLLMTFLFVMMQIM